MKKTIEERAKESLALHYEESRYTFNKEHYNMREWEYGYCQGATEQKAIDVDKACESVCRLCANCECCSQKDRRECPTIDSFRKTMMNN